ncbi:hypothetical protein [Streptomyces sp. NBC_01614]|uniref:hypothetical protein n=1 Tax=Streptomyces sp. NBC_01614 TaxID=2975897 RepID=UPI00386DB720
MEAQHPSIPSPSKPGVFASFARFVVCGGGVGLLTGAVVPLLATAMSWALANALVTVASTLLCTELHALFTFGTGRRPDLREHLRSAGSAFAAYVVTTAAMLLLTRSSRLPRCSGSRPSTSPPPAWPSSAGSWCCGCSCSPSGRRRLRRPQRPLPRRPLAGRPRLSPLASRPSTR